MKKNKLILSFAGLMMVGSAAISQNAESGKQSNNQVKPAVQLSTSKENQQHKAKPASSMATEHPKIVDKKEAIKQNNSQKK